MQTILITGAASGIGKACARHFERAGARLVLVDKQAGDGITKGDVSDPDFWDGLDLPPLTGAVVNAGIGSFSFIGDTDFAEWRRVMAVNLDGAFYLARAFLAGMKARGWGRIVNVCSLGIKTGGLTAGTAYVSSKGGLGVLTFSLARESAGQGVTVNGIAPGYVLTPMVTEQLTEEQRQNLLREIPVGRFCAAEEVAHLVGYLASEHAGFITGEIVDINGGLHMD